MRRPRLSAKAYMLLTNGTIVCLWSGGLVLLAWEHTQDRLWAEALSPFLLVAGLVGLFLHRLKLARFYTRVLIGLRSGGGLLSAAAHELREAARHGATTSAEQAAAVTETAATIEQLAATAKAIADGARSVAVAAEQTGETMVETQSAVEAIAERSLGLGERSQHIGEILELIGEIAEQTNLLAL